MSPRCPSHRASSAWRRAWWFCCRTISGAEDREARYRVKIASHYLESGSSLGCLRRERGKRFPHHWNPHSAPTALWNRADLKSSTESPRYDFECVGHRFCTRIQPSSTNGRGSSHAGLRWSCLSDPRDRWAGGPDDEFCQGDSV